jgi:hypothetical protein
MAEPVGVGEAWRKAIEAYMGYYQNVGQLTVGYLRSVADIMENVKLPAQIGPVLAPARTPQRADAPALETSLSAVSSNGDSAPPEPAMVLEAAATDEALGVFLVENRLRKRVSAPVSASTFADDRGRETQPALRFDPEVVSLEPGEQMLVRVIATMGDDLEPGTGYRGELTVPGLSGSPIPIVVRRRAPAARPRKAPARKAPARKAPVRKTPTRSASRKKSTTKSASRSRSAKTTGT